MAGHVIAVDAGSTHVRLRVSTIDRRLLHSRVYRLPASQLLLGEEISHAVADELAATLAAADASWGPLRMIGIAVPSRVVGPQGDRNATRQQEIFSRFEPPAGVPVILENNVNCAAVAERSNGIAGRFRTFAYVQIGLKIGMGLMLGGKLLRGRNGAAGEIGHRAFPMADGTRPIAGEIERYMGTEAFMLRVLATWSASAGAPPADAAELMLRAAEGCTVSLEHVTRHAEDIGAIVASCVSVVDPGLVVLGGGIGGQPLAASYCPGGGKSAELSRGSPHQHARPGRDRPWHREIGQRTDRGSASRRRPFLNTFPNRKNANGRFPVASGGFFVHLPNLMIDRILRPIRRVF